MNLIEYRRSISRKIRRELICRVRHFENEFVILPSGYTTINEIITWLDKNKDIFKVIEIDKDRIDVELINYEKYLAETQKQNSTQYDKEIEKLEARLKELYQLQKNEREVNRKKKKVAELQKQLKELGVEIK